jgi:MFS family permease
MADAAAQDPSAPAISLRPAYLIMAAAALIVMFLAIFSPSLWFLTWVHIMSGVLWTGIDLFLGFVIGPVIRRLPFETRRAMIGALIPRTMILMPTLAIVTGTAGYYLAQRMGYMDLGYPEFYWVAAALAILVVLTVQGLGILTPVNVLVYLEIQKPKPNADKIARWMKTYVRVVALQGIMQVAMIVIMARFGSGL